MEELTFAETWQGVEDSIAKMAKKRLLFVTGAVKSGTTWTQMWLDQHPNAACRGEGYFFNKFAPDLQKHCMSYNTVVAAQAQDKGTKPPPFPPITRPHLQHLVRQTILGCLAAYGIDDDIHVIAEKTPSNVKYLDAVFALFPQARVLNIVRDGRDVSISAWHENKRRSPDLFLQKYPTIGTFLPDIAQIWVDHQEPIHAAMAARPDQVMQIHYEDLIAAPEPVVRQVFDWLELESSDATLAKCLGNTSFDKLSDGRKPGEEDANSFFRKGTAEQWRDDLTDEQQETFWRIAGEMMEAQGYNREGRVRG